MKKKPVNNIKLGIFVSICFLLLLTGIYFIGVRQHLFSNTFRLSGIFTNINGLQVGGNVRFSGINVGIVEDIRQISDTTVQVDMQIEEHSRKFIKKSATATISSDGLMGDKIVAISAGKFGSEVVGNDDIITTVPQVNMDDILADMKVTSTNAVRITNELAFIMENVGDGNGIIGKMFFDSTFAEVMQAAMINLKEGAGGFKQNMDAASHSFLLKGYLKKKQREKEEKENAEEKDPPANLLDKGRFPKKDKTKGEAK